MIRVESFRLSPGRCFRCTSTGPGVDTERDLGHLNGNFVDGQVYWCDNCIREANQLIGGATAAEVTELTAERDGLTEENTRLEAELAAALDAVDEAQSFVDTATKFGLVPKPPPAKRGARKTTVDA